MAVFVISFCIGDTPKYSEVWSSLDKVVRAEATGKVVFDETTSFYVIKSERTSADLLDAIYFGSDLLDSRDSLVVINLSLKSHASRGLATEQKLNGLLADR